MVGEYSFWGLLGGWKAWLWRTESTGAVILALALNWTNWPDCIGMRFSTPGRKKSTPEKINQIRADRLRCGGSDRVSLPRWHCVCSYAHTLIYYSKGTTAGLQCLLNVPWYTRTCQYRLPSFLCHRP